MCFGESFANTVPTNSSSSSSSNNNSAGLMVHYLVLSAIQAAHLDLLLHCYRVALVMNCTHSKAQALVRLLVANCQTRCIYRRLHKWMRSGCYSEIVPYHLYILGCCTACYCVARAVPCCSAQVTSDLFFVHVQSMEV